MSDKQYVAVPILDDTIEDDDDTGFDPRRQKHTLRVPPGGVVPVPSSPSSPPTCSPPSTNSTAARTRKTSADALELTTLHSLSSPGVSLQPDSAHSSVAGDESTCLVGADEPDSTANADEPNKTSEGTTTGPAGLIILDPRPPAEGEITVSLMRLGGSGLGNVQVNVSVSSPVRALASRVFASDISDGMRVRLIYMGRVLPDDATIGSVGVAHGNILHALVTAAPPPSEANDEATPTSTQPIAHPVLHAAPSDGYPGSLRQMYTDEELLMMQQAQLEFSRDRVGSNIEFLIGILLGSVLGPIALLWFLNSAVSRKQRLGILVGVVINVGLRVNNLQDTDSTDTTDSSSGSTDSDSSGSGSTNDNGSGSGTVSVGES